MTAIVLEHSTTTPSFMRTSVYARSVDVASKGVNSCVSSFLPKSDQIHGKFRFVWDRHVVQCGLRSCDGRQKKCTNTHYSMKKWKGREIFDSRIVLMVFELNFYLVLIVFQLKFYIVSDRRFAQCGLWSCNDPQRVCTQHIIRLKT